MASIINYGGDCTSRACPFLSAGAGVPTVCIGDRCALWVECATDDGEDWSTCVLNKQLDQTTGVFFQLKNSKGR